MILFSSEDCWALQINIFQESNKLVDPGGLPTFLYKKNSKIVDENWTRLMVGK